MAPPENNEDNNKKKNEKEILNHNNNSNDNEKIIKKMAVGKWFDRFIVGVFLLSVFETQTYVRLNNFKGNLAICYEMTINTITTINFYLWVIFYN